jgi:hypothetical protein
MSYDKTTDHSPQYTVTHHNMGSTNNTYNHLKHHTINRINTQSHDIQSLTATSDHSLQHPIA